jgi:hypothetical protein
MDQRGGAKQLTSNEVLEVLRVLAVLVVQC